VKESVRYETFKREEESISRSYSEFPVKERSPYTLKVSA
jgi:hypothetical protein